MGAKSINRNIMASDQSTELNIQLPHNNCLIDKDRIARLDQGSLLKKGKVSEIPADTEKHGPVTLENGAVYTGGWYNKLRNGNGMQDWPDGSRYVGEWLNDMAHGYGILYLSNGDKYEGAWLYNKANGKGIYSHVNSSRYSGDWLDD